MPRSKESNQKIKDDRSAQILSAALKLFATKGLSATRITDISLETGISQGLIYHYYQSKEEIFIKLIERAIDRLNEAALNLEKLSITAEEKIKLAIDGLMKGFGVNSDTAYYYFLITQAAMSETFPSEAREIIRTRNDIKYEAMTRIMIQGIKDGTIKKNDPRELATLFFSTINGLALHKAIYGINSIMPANGILFSIFLTNVKQ